MLALIFVTASFVVPHAHRPACRGSSASMLCIDDQVMLNLAPMGGVAALAYALRQVSAATGVFQPRSQAPSAKELKGAAELHYKLGR